MDIGARKLQILSAIVNEYIRTGEPVGSKRVAQLLDLQISSATIRNEMAVLFDLGLLEQPHTSAGRIPSHLGFRVYLDQLLHCRALTEEEKDGIDALFNVRNPDPDRLLSDAAQALANFTGCATVSATSTPEHIAVRRIDVIPVAPRAVMILVIATNGVIKNKVCRVDVTLTPEILEFFAKFSNDRFAGRSLHEISLGYVNSVAVALGEYSRVFTPLLACIFDLCKQIFDGQYFVGGNTNLLAYKEFSGVAHELLTLLEKRETFGDISTASAPSVTVTIGKENSLSELSNTAVVVARYNVGPDLCGAIGVIGPVRLDYSRLIPHLEYFAQTLGSLLTDTMEQDEEH
ncbi:MAG: heat-inducible transcriptional repressor HrcA [Oscillospiraceae bacterium]|nr:heat-inducible transcriptional repressor HrcA [Oscillospiraceae bacterium]